MLVDGVDNPVDASVVTDLGMRRIDQNDFKVLHGGILIDPVRVQDTQVGVLASNLLFSETLQIALELELVDTLMPRGLRKREIEGLE
jgi:hypothetical protein